MNIRKSDISAKSRRLTLAIASVIVLSCVISFMLVQLNPRGNGLWTDYYYYYYYY
jgi:hypothetical protein